MQPRLVQWKRASSLVEVGTSGFLSISDSDCRVPEELGQEGKASSCVKECNFTCLSSCSGGLRPLVELCVFFDNGKNQCLSQLRRIHPLVTSLLKWGPGLPEGLRGSPEQAEQEDVYSSLGERQGERRSLSLAHLFPRLLPGTLGNFPGCL